MNDSNEEYLLYKRGMRDIRNFDNIDLLPHDEFTKYMEEDQEIWNSLLGLTN